MLYAIHKETGRTVSARKIMIDASWIGTKRDVWICPEHQIATPKIERINKGINEVEMSFVESTNRQVHFRRKTEEVRLVEDVSESSEHLTAKEKIYDLIWDKEIKFLINNQVKTIDDFKDFDDIFIEERIGTNHKIADVLIRFKGADPILNKGIAFEVQFSKQSSQRTLERTWQRLLEGYCVIWLFQDDFDKSLNLIKPIVEIETYENQLKEYKDHCENDIEMKIREHGLKIDEKINELRKFKELCESEIEYKKRTYRDEITKEFQESMKDLINQGNILSSNVNEKFRTDILQIAKQKKEDLKEEISKILPILKREIINEVIVSDSIKQLIVAELSSSIKNIFEESKDLEKIKDEINMKVRSLMEGHRLKVQQDVLDKVHSESDRLLKSKAYDECLKTRFGTDLAEFARTYLNNEMHKLKKEMMKDGD